LDYDIVTNGFIYNKFIYIKKYTFEKKVLNIESNLQRSNYEFNIFIEGKDNNFSDNIIIKNHKNKNYVESFNIENNDLQLFLENKVYKVVYKDYFNYVTYDNNLRGYIRGEITQTNCTPVNPTDFVIHCYRNHDHHFIGEYKIISGLYEIPNLYFNYFYDIIIVDKNRNFEQKVSSHRKPILQI
jgi:hypothetical protein